MPYYWIVNQLFVSLGRLVSCSQTAFFVYLCGKNGLTTGDYRAPVMLDYIAIRGHHVFKDYFTTFIGRIRRSNSLRYLSLHVRRPFLFNVRGIPWDNFIVAATPISADYYRWWIVRKAHECGHFRFRYNLARGNYLPLSILHCLQAKCSLRREYFRQKAVRVGREDLRFN